MRSNILSGLIVAAVTLLTAACGVSSVHPIVADENAVTDSRLAGAWAAADGSDSALITATGDRSWRIAYREGDGKTGNFYARLGTLGQLRVLDVIPDDPAPNASGLYRGLVLRAHGVLVIDGIDEQSLRFRLIEPDSLKRFLERSPRATPHTVVDENVLLTGESAEVRRFLTEFVRRPGVLGEQEVWRRLRTGAA